MGNTLKKAFFGPTYEEEKARERATANAKEKNTRLPRTSLTDELAWNSHFSTDDVRKLNKSFLEAAAQSEDPTQIQREQFRDILKDAGLDEAGRSNAYLNRLFSVCDANKSGTINFREYVLAMSVLSKGSTAEKFKLSFEIYDKDETGGITREEMIEVLTSLDVHSQEIGLKANEGLEPKVVKKRAERVKKLVDEIFKESDLDNSGRLTYPEYFKAVLKNHWLVNFDPEV
eukprot:g4453.t1